MEKSKNLERTSRDPNKLEIHGDICYIHLYNKDVKLTAKAMIDIEDIPKIESRKWRLIGRGYVGTHAKQTRSTQLLHHFIVGYPPEGRQVDHINRNKLDNRKVNLRLATSSQNNANVGLRKSNTSGFKGVSFCKRSHKYEARIHYQGKRYRLGYFDDSKEASIVYNNKAQEFHGEYAYKEETSC